MCHENHVRVKKGKWKKEKGKEEKEGKKKTEKRGGKGEEKRKLRRKKKGKRRKKKKGGKRKKEKKGEKKKKKGEKGKKRGVGKERGKKNRKRRKKRAQSMLLLGQVGQGLQMTLCPTTQASLFADSSVCCHHPNGMGSIKCKAVGKISLHLSSEHTCCSARRAAGMGSRQLFRHVKKSQLLPTHTCRATS